MQHPNVVTVREIVVGSNTDKIYIVMDFVEHDMKSLMETMRKKNQVFLPGHTGSHLNLADIDLKGLIDLLVF